MVDLGQIDPSDLARATVEADRYTLGTSRTLEQFEDVSGVCFRQGTINERAKSGDLAPEQFADHLLSILSGFIGTPSPSSSTSS
jgi:hypothetical protein